MTDCAWMSVAAVNSEIFVGLTNAQMELGSDEQKQAVLDAIRKNKGGNAIPDGILPRPFFAWRDKSSSEKPLTKPLPHLALSGFHFVSSQVADVLRQFDLGGCKLHPVEVLMEDRKTPLPGSYFVLDFNSWKDVFLPKYSPDFPSRDGASGIWKPKMVTKDDALVLSNSALMGADIWWNPNIWGAFFLSDRLVQALRAAGVDKPFSLRRCRIE